MGFFFEDASFPQTSEVDNVFLQEAENSLRKSFLLADGALADDCSVSKSSGTTALTALIFGRYINAEHTSFSFLFVKCVCFLSDVYVCSFVFLWLHHVLNFRPSPK